MRNCSRTGWHENIGNSCGSYMFCKQPASFHDQVYDKPVSRYMTGVTAGGDSSHPGAIIPCM